MPRTISDYNTIMRRCTVLSAAEQDRLLANIEAGIDVVNAESLLVTANTRFVYKIAHRYARCGTEDFDTVFNSGLMGLVTAIRQFDRTREFKLITYAVWWIRQSILRTRQEESNSFGGTTNILNRLSLLRKKYETIADKDTPEARDLQRSILSIERTLSSPALRIGTSTRKDTEGSNDLMDIADTRADAAFLEVEANDLRRFLQTSMMRCLEPLDIRIVRLYYGIGCAQHTFDEVSIAVKKYTGDKKLSRERIRQRIVCARKKLLVHMQRRGVHNYSAMHVEMELQEVSV